MQMNGWFNCYSSSITQKAATKIQPVPRRKAKVLKPALPTVYLYLSINSPGSICYIFLGKLVSVYLTPLRHLGISIIFRIFLSDLPQQTKGYLNNKMQDLIDTYKTRLISCKPYIYKWTEFSMRFSLYNILSMGLIFTTKLIT